MKSKSSLTCEWQFSHEKVKSLVKLLYFTDMGRVAFTLISFLVLTRGHATTMDQQFRVDWKQDRIEIFSPKKRNQNTSFVLKNETLVPVKYRVGNEEKTFRAFTLRPQQEIVLEIPNSVFEDYELRAQSPPAKAIPLRFSRGKVTLRRQ